MASTRKYTMMARPTIEGEEDDCVLFGSDSEDDEFRRKEVFCFFAPPRTKQTKRFSLFPMYRVPQTRYNLSVKDACCLARAGDLLLFNGCGTSSAMVRLFTPSRYSHVAIVIQMKNDETGEIVPFLVEAVRHKDTNLDVCGKHSAGVRVVPMRERLETYRGYTLAIRTMMCRKSYLARVSKFINGHLERFANEYMYRGYNHDWRDFFNARVPFFRNTEYGARYDKQDTRREFFCSELVAQCFIEAGMLDGMSASASSYSPDSFSEAGALSFTTPEELFGADIKYGPELFVDLPCLEGGYSHK